MGAWLADNWYVIVGPAGAAAIIAYRVHGRGGDEPLGRRIAYSMFPVLDPLSPERRSLTPRALVLFAIGVIILGVLAFTGVISN
jgi:hypothetical protein